MDKKKLLIIIGSIIILIIGVVAVIYFVSNEDKNNDNEEQDPGSSEVQEPTTNDNAGVIEDKEVDGLKFTNTSLVSTVNSATLTTLVTNTTDSDIEVRIFDIVIKDESGTVIVTTQGYVGGVVPSNESREIVTNFDINLDNATDVEYSLVN